jgi:hypothetical protein
MRPVRLFAVVLSFCLMARAQFTLVTGTVVDPNTIPYGNGTILSVLVLPGNVSPTLNGQSYLQPTQATGLDPTGHFSLRLADNNILLPAGTKWNFTICSAGGSVQPSLGKGPVCFSLAAPITISGSSQDISTQLNAVALALTNIASGNTAINPTNGVIPVRSSSGAFSDSPFSVSGGVVTSAGSPGVAGQVAFGQGTLPSILGGQVGITVPSSVTAYQFILPGASGSGFLLDTAASNQDTLSRVATTGSGNVVLAAGPTFANATCTGTCTGFGGSTANTATLQLHGNCSGPVGSTASGLGGVDVVSLGSLVNGSLCNAGTGNIDKSGGAVLTRTCLLQKLFVNSKTAGGATGDGVFTVQDGASATTLTCTMNTSAACNDTTHTFSGSAGDMIWIIGLTTSTNLSNISVSLECD